MLQFSSLSSRTFARSFSCFYFSSLLISHLSYMIQRCPERMKEYLNKTFNRILCVHFANIHKQDCVYRSHSFPFFHLWKIYVAEMFANNYYIIFCTSSLCTSSICHVFLVCIMLLTLTNYTRINIPVHVMSPHWLGH